VTLSSLCFTGDIPLHRQIREGMDAGQPIVVTHPDSPQVSVRQCVCPPTFIYKTSLEPNYI